MALLAALATPTNRPGLPALVAAHVDHRLRADSALDVAAAETFARRLGVPFVSRAVEIDATRGGLEAAAREARYAALEAMAVEAGCGAVATGHTATDQAETLLLRLLRGAGTRGLGGMAADRALGPLRLLRPLLGLPREQTRAFCERAGVVFRDDPTNVDDRPRARLRHEVLPVLERLGPDSVGRIAAAAGRLQADEALLAALAAEAAAQAGDELARLAALPGPLRRRVLAAWAGRVSGAPERLASSHLAGLERLVATGEGAVELPTAGSGRVVASKAGGRLAAQVLDGPPGGPKGAARLKPGSEEA